jgi:type IV pilus assembly protein PilO
MQKIPFWGQVLLMLLVSALIVGVAYWFMPGLKAMGEEIQAIRSEYAKLEVQVREGQATEAKLPEFEREVASLQRKLNDILQILPSGPETGDLLRWIKVMTDQANLDLKTFAPGELRPVDFYKAFPIDMEVVGRYHDLGVFLDRVSKYSRIVNVDNLRMNTNPGGGDKTIRSTFTATTFVCEEGGVPKPEEAKP